MIDRLAELNRVLDAVTALADDEGAADVQRIVRHCSEVVFEGRFPDHEETVAFADRLGFLAVIGGRAALTDEGRAFLELNTEGQYELSDDQKRLLIRNSFLQGPLRLETLALVRSLSPAYAESTFRWSPVDSARLGGPAWLLNQLRQIGLLRSHQDGLEVSPEYVEPVAFLRAEGKGWSKDKLEEFLREREEVGALGERLAMAFERDRLKRLGHHVESLSVRHIGNLKMDAGYDIESFNGRSPAVTFDRFIEVKGSRGPKLRFIWSANEMKVARQLGDKYWIYFQGGIDAKAGIARTKTLLFQDPIVSILKNAAFTASEHGVLIEGGVQGDVVAQR